MTQEPNNLGKMHPQWLKLLSLLFCGIKMTLCCSKRLDYDVDDPKELVPEGLPTRMLGWEQMILMFSHKPPSEVIVRQ